MLIRKPDDIRSSEITPESVYRSRREFVKDLAIGGGLLATAGFSHSALAVSGQQMAQAALQPGDDLTPERIATSYNNFYEFGMDKADPAQHAHTMSTQPWEVMVSGEAAKTGKFDLSDIIKGLSVEERIYRFRCVEAWSMVIPWSGIEMKSVLEQFEPNGNAQYVEFTTLERPSEMRGQRSLFSGIDWPYIEGLRMDEAYHPLTLMATGLYGKDLPNQNGAPWRLMVPWKYGFKSVKSIVKIHFTARQPKNTWNVLAPNEYGFYGNVNPAVAHPRWSQASERRLPSSLLNQNRIPTLPFNGYADQVASLYAGMDLRRNF
ncbi:MAG: protein-methionine-sulfoxide reductase catalytic subunit MsrP [Proteobacteria bacterium]|nr:protein-methionine-sulfoxide reductase catalytic subunit MsrP [Pseudomonadota bacterium]